MTASDLQAQIMLALSRGDTRLFRANAGSAWAGTIVERTPTRLVLLNYRPVRMFVKGASDLIGFSGPTFCAVEVKFGRDRIRPEQAAFIELVLASGGRAGIARSVAEAEQIIRMEVRK